MRRAVAQWLRLAGAGEDEIYEMLVACGEACANTVAHAHPALSDSSFEVRAEREGPEVEITVRDTGRWRPPGEESRGRGLAVMRELMDDVEIEPSEQRHDRQAAAAVARRGCGMRDPLAELSFETAGNVVVGRVAGEIESVNAEEMSTALAGAVDERQGRAGHRPVAGDLPRQRRNRAALRPGAKTADAPPAAATRGAGGCPHASRPRAVRHRSGRPDRRDRRGRARGLGRAVR